MKLLPFVLLALVACSKSSSSGGADGDACDAPINKAVDSMMGPTTADTPPQMKAIGDKLRGIYITACKTDHWPAEVLQCFASASDQPSIKKCREKLPPDQAQHVQPQILAAMSGAGG